MIHAYNEMYLNDVMHNLAAYFDIAINALGISEDEIEKKFLDSNVVSGIERGHPNYLSGKSATEMLSETLKENVEFNKVPLDRSPEYWAGWVLAYSQWYLNKSFKTIFNVMPLKDLIGLYNPYHEAPEMKTAELIKSFFPSENPIKRYRKLRNLSQKQLSDLSGVKLRSIQSYEQGNNEIAKASGETIYALAKTLDCTIEDLLN